MIRPVLLLSCLLALCPAIAAAQAEGDTKAAANALFDEGKRLVIAGKAAQACPKFEASLKLVDQLGVRLNLADCYEQQGKTASAWTTFREAASLADKRDDDRAGYAQERAAALAPKLSRLQISVAAESELPGLTVTRDGIALPEEAFGSALPVNPGTYTVEAKASGYRTWKTKVEVKGPGTPVVLEIPVLVAAPEIEVGKGEAGAAGRFDRSAQRSRRRLAYVVGAGGVVALGAGVGFGFAAKRKWDSAGAHCDDNDLCDDEGTEINRKAQLYGNIGTVVVSVGVAALVTGAVLYVTAPSARPVLEHARLSIEPAADGRSTVRLGFATSF